MDNDLNSSSESEVNTKSEIEEQLQSLQSMKKLLKKKERSLSRYNKALKARDHVRNTVLRKNFKISCKVPGFEVDAESNKNDDSDVKRVKRLKSVPFGGSINSKISETKRIDFKSSVTEELGIDFKSSVTEELDKCSGKEVQDLRTLMNEETCENSKDQKPITEETNFLEETETWDLQQSLQNSADHQNLTDSTRMQSVDSNSITPVLLRRRCRTGVLSRKRHVKRLFQNNNNNNEEKGCSVKQSDCISGTCESSSLANTNEQKLASFSDFEQSDISLLQENSCVDELQNGNRLKMKPIFIIKDDSLCASEHILFSCISLPKDGSPFAFILYHGKFTIWRLRNNEKSKSKLMWVKCHDQSNVLLQDLNTRKFCTFGGGLIDFVYFVVIKAPQGTGCPFEIIYLSFSPQEKLQVIQKSFSILGCSECSFYGRDLQLWEFVFCIDSCKNSSCSNWNCFGIFTIVTFDVIYSQKKKEWNLELDLKERCVSEFSLQSVNLLNSCDYAVSSTLDHLNILWQDASGELGVASGRSFFSIIGVDLCCELRNELSSGVVIYGAVVKEILFLILKLETYLKFLALNPLTCEFDTLYKIKLRDLDMSGIGLCSAIFYENKFFFVSSDAEVRCLIL